MSCFQVAGAASVRKRTGVISFNERKIKMEDRRRFGGSMESRSHQTNVYARATALINDLAASGRQVANIGLLHVVHDCLALVFLSPMVTWKSKE